MLAALVCAAMAASAVAGFVDSCRNPPACPAGWDEHCDRCFRFIPEALSWVDAQKNCQSLGGTLAAVRNYDEYEAVQWMIASVTNSVTETWLGGSDAQQDEEWFWNDKTAFSYSNWCPGEPDGGAADGCMKMNAGAAGCWADAPCSSLLPSMCALKLHIV